MDPSAAVPSVCFIDGDSQQQESEQNRVFRLPGASPEGHVFDTVVKAWDAIGGQLTVALLQPYEQTPSVKTMLEEVRRDTMDEHLLYSVAGQRLGFIPEETVRHAFGRFWCVAKPGLAATIRDQVMRNMRS